MRETKYRCWNKRDEKMEYLDYLNLSKANFCGSWVEKPSDNLFDIATTQGTMLCLDDVILMQYINRQDGNNIDIFEGDLIKNDREDDVFVVIYCEEDSCFALKEIDGEQIWTFCRVDTYLVVGNIYQNKGI